MDVPGLKADVFFGDAAQPPPDWRAADGPQDDEDDTSEENRRAVSSILGFDPTEGAEEGGPGAAFDDGFRPPSVGASPLRGVGHLTNGDE